MLLGRDNKHLISFAGDLRRHFDGKFLHAFILKAQSVIGRRVDGRNATLTLCPSVE